VRRRIALPLLLLALAGSIAARAKDGDEDLYIAVRTENGMILREPGASDDRCIDVYGRTAAIEAIVPADGEPHPIAASVEAAAKAQVHPPTYSAFADAPGISSSAFVFLRGEQRFLECSIDTVYVLNSARRLEDR
jgi:hypothetical protein